MGEPMTEAEARERLSRLLASRGRLPQARNDAGIDRALATTDALAVLLDWHEMGKRLTKEQWVAALEGGEETDTLWDALRAFDVIPDPEVAGRSTDVLGRRIVPDEEGAG